MSIFIIYKAWEIDGRREVASRTEENYSKNQGLYVKSSTTNGRKNMKGLVENIEKKSIHVFLDMSFSILDN